MKIMQYQNFLETFQLKKKRIGFFLGWMTVVSAVIASFVTYFILTGLTSIRPTHSVVITCLLINSILIIAMICIIGFKVFQLWTSRLRENSGAKLHIRIVTLFSVMIAIPAIVLATFANISLDRGLDHGFSSRTKSIVQNSINVAKGFIREHSKVVAEHVKLMASDLNNAVDLAKDSPEKYKKFLETQAYLRNFPLLFIINDKGEILSTGANRRKDLFLPPLKRDLEDAKDGKTLVISPRSKPMIRAIKKLDAYQNAYLYVTYPLDPKILRYLRGAYTSVAEYRALQEKRSSIQFAMFFMYSTIALTLLLAAIWTGIWFANRLVRPISALIDAAQSVSKGDLDVQVKVKERDGDLATLNKTFNNMTLELRSQRDALMDTNLVLDDRRRFMETVLSGVSAGVIGINADGMITLANASAISLLDIDLESLIGSPLKQKLPSFSEVFDKAQHDVHKNRTEQQVDILMNGQERHFAVRVTREGAANKDCGFVITFDDITELVTAQRNMAWADIARRIAHEIKNPLTPIQLSAERIRRKYSSQIETDKEIFNQCTDTIIRQVGDIGRMVDEFSSFARMPQPVMTPYDIRNVIRDAFFLFRTSHPEIEFKLDNPKEPIISLCDQRLLSQVMTNLVKNASEAIEAAKHVHDQNKTQGKTTSYKGLIAVRIQLKDTEHYLIEVIDNGCGLPKTKRNKLLEPYMTTREKGTGLGLAIVKKITEQHGGTLQLRDAPKDEESAYDNDLQGRGACIRLTFPVINASADDMKNDKKIAENINSDGDGKVQQNNETQQHQKEHNNALTANTVTA
ncbi:MAG: PAS domain-containing sensor histidine kinase [Pseudomonadota bacterium]